MVRALALFTMPLLTRYLSPDAYGQAALAGTVISLASVFALAGIDMSYTRHVFSGQVGSSVEVEAFCWRWTLLSAGVLALLVGALWHALAGRLGLPAGLAGFVVVGVFASALATLAQTRARLQGAYSRLSWVQFATGCIAAATSVGIAVTWRRDAWALLMAMAISYAMPVFLLGTPSWRRLAKPSGVSQRTRLMATGLAGVVTAPAYWAVSSSDRWFLAAFHDSSVVGIYSIGYTVGTIGVVVSNAVTNAWLPELSRDESTGGATFVATKARMTELLVVLLMIVGVGVTAAGGDVIRGLADARFHQAVVVVPWLAAAVFFNGCMHVGTALLVLRGKLHWAGYAWAAALVASVLLNRWMVPVHGALGAAVTQALSFLLVSALVWAAALRSEPLRLDWSRMAAGFTLSALVAASMREPWAATAWQSLLIKLPVGLLFAVGCLWVVTPSVFVAGVRKVKGLA